MHLLYVSNYYLLCISSKHITFSSESDVGITNIKIKTLVAKRILHFNGFYNIRRILKVWGNG